MLSGERHRIDRTSETNSQIQEKTTDYSRKILQQVNRKAGDYDYGRQDYTTSIPEVHPFHKEAIQKARNIASGSGKPGDHNITPPSLAADIEESILRQPGNPWKSFEGRGGIQEDADAYLNYLDTHTPGADAGNAREEMSKFDRLKVRYTRKRQKGTFDDSEGLTPIQKAAAEEPVGYEISNEYRRIQKRKNGNHSGKQVSKSQPTLMSLHKRGRKLSLP